MRHSNLFFPFLLTQQFIFSSTVHDEVDIDTQPILVASLDVVRASSDEQPLNAQIHKNAHACSSHVSASPAAANMSVDSLVYHTSVMSGVFASHASCVDIDINICIDIDIALTAIFYRTLFCVLTSYQQSLYIWRLKIIITASFIFRTIFHTLPTRSLFPMCVLINVSFIDFVNNYVVDLGYSAIIVHTFCDSTLVAMHLFIT